MTRHKRREKDIKRFMLCYKIVLCAQSQGEETRLTECLKKIAAVVKQLTLSLPVNYCTVYCILYMHYMARLAYLNQIFNS